MKSLNRLCLLTLGLLLLATCTGCRGPRTFEQENFRFIVASDPQLFRGKIEDLDKAVEAINDFAPEYVFICGDLIETPSNQQQIEAYKDSVSNLSDKITLHNIAGNHDLGRPFKIENAQAYERNFGKLWYHFVRGNNLFIILSSDILQAADAPMKKQQMDWLKNTLNRFRSKTMNNKFIFMHHPLYVKTPDEKDAYVNMPSGIRKELLDLLTEHNITAVFSGHLHNNRINRYNGVDLITTNSMTVPLGKAPAGFRIVEVKPGGYEHRYHTTEEIEKSERTK